MGEIRIIATFSGITSETLAEFTRRLAAAVAGTREEPGTFQYDVILSEDQTTAIVLEKYADSEACLAHLARVAPVIGDVAEVAGGLSLAVTGDVSAGLREATSVLDTSFYTTLAAK